jgi:hypothetical protein
VVSMPVRGIAGYETPLTLKGNSANLKIVNAIRNHLREVDSNIASSRVFVSFVGEVNKDSLQWLALQQSTPLQFSDLSMVNDISVYEETIWGSDFIVVADEDAVGINRSLPSYTVQKPVLKFLREQPSFEEIMVLTTGTINGSIRLFANQASLEKQHTVSLSYPVSGFLPPEGPYPQWKLPVVRWGLFPESRILLPDELSGTVEMHLSARGQIGAKLLVTLNTEEIYHHVFNGESFEEMAIPLTIASGIKVVRFRYDRFTDGKDNFKRTILFGNIRIIGPRQKSISALSGRIH